MLAEGLQVLLQRLTEMKWSDYLDILLVAYLFYLVLPLIHSNSALRVGRVVVALVVVTWITDALDMYTLNFLLTQVLTVGVIALIVLFQPELRRMMDHLGSVKLSALLAPKEKDTELQTVISQTVMACEIMSREKVGALIVSMPLSVISQPSAKTILSMAVEEEGKVAYLPGLARVALSNTLNSFKFSVLKSAVKIYPR